MPQFDTWTALLAHWTAMAGAARAIDGVADGPLSRAIPSIITCQALVHAFTDVLDLPDDERSLAIDRASAALARIEAQCETEFTQVPPLLEAVQLDAAEALDDLRLACCWTLVWEGPDQLRVAAPPKGVPARGDCGTLLLALEGTVLLPGTPVGWWTGRHEPMLGHWIAGLQARPCRRGVQVWRTVDAHGRWVRDDVLDVDQDGPMDATPLLAPRVVEGARLRPPVPVPQWIGALTPPKGVIVSWRKD